MLCYVKTTIHNIRMDYDNIIKTIIFNLIFLFQANVIKCSR